MRRLVAAAALLLVLATGAAEPRPTAALPPSPPRPVIELEPVSIDPLPALPTDPPPRLARRPVTVRSHPASVSVRSQEPLSGTASWYAYVPGQAAAGRALRVALGPRWRGMTVRVRLGGAYADVVLTDSMKADRLIDLDVRSFDALAPRAVGLLAVTVVRLP